MEEARQHPALAIAAEGAELAALVAKTELALPKMLESLNRMSSTAEALHGELDAFLHDKGIRGRPQIER